MKPKSAFFFLFAFSLLFIACKPPEKPVTKEEALTLAKAIANSTKNKNVKLFRSYFDYDAMADKIAIQSENKLTKEEKYSLKAGFDNADLPGKIIQPIGNDGTYEFVKHYEKDKIQHLIFRLYASEGMNYHDFELINKNGKPKIADIYVYLTGENISKTFSDLMLNNRSFSAKKLKEINSIKQIRAMLTNGENEKALEAFNKISADLRIQKSFQIIYIEITSKIDNELYSKAIEEYKNSFPNEPNIYLMLVDNYILNKQFDKAIFCINKVDSMINKDPFLDYYRGLVYNSKGDSKMAQQHFEAAYKDIPGFDDNVIELIAHYADNNQLAKSKQLLAEYKADKKRNQEKLENLYFSYPQLKL
jgi:hypothetical protein